MEEHTTTKTSYASPFIDKFKTTQDNANKEFDQFYTYFSKAVTPKRSEATSTKLLNQSHRIYKPTPKNTSRIRQDLQLNSNKRENNSTSLTPLLEKQLFMQNDNEDINSSRYIDSPSRRSAYRYRPNIPPSRPMTLTPNTQRTSSTRQSLLQSSFPEESEEPYSSVYFSPSRTPIQPPHFNINNNNNTNSNIEMDHLFDHQNSTSHIDINNTSHLSSYSYPSSPSAILHDRLIDESKRLDKLQHDILFIKRQSSLLANYGPLSKEIDLKQLRENNHNDTDIDITMKSPIRHLKPSISSSANYHNNNTSITSTIKSIKSNINTNTKKNNAYSTNYNRNNSINISDKRKMDQLSTNLMTPYSIRHLPSSSTLLSSSYFLSPSISTPTFKTKPKKPIHEHQKQQQSTAINGSQQENMNNLLDDISKAKLKSTKIISTPNGRRVKNKFWSEIHENEEMELEEGEEIGQQKVQDDEEADFWMDKKGPKSHLTHRLHQTLDQELNQANDKSLLLEEEKKQQHIKSNSFQLIPNPNHSFMDELQHTIKSKKIDGDNWTFNGQHYVVDETKSN